MTWKVYIADDIIEYPSEAVNATDIPQCDYYVTELPVAANAELEAMKRGIEYWVIEDPKGNKKSWDSYHLYQLMEIERIAG